MRRYFKTLTVAAAALLIGLSAGSAKAGHFPNDYDGDFTLPSQWEHEEARTNGVLPNGMIFYPYHLTSRPEHYGFLPEVSNWDAQNKHPAQWHGQEWNPEMWDQNQWTPAIAIRKFFQARYFDKQYMRAGKPPLPVLELGPRFYGMSDLDQRRMLKLRLGQ